jgi:hypothetical protein
VERVEFEAKLVGARLRVASATDLPTGRLVDGGSIAGHDATRLDADMDGSVARVHLNAGEKHGIIFFPRAKERWDLRLPAELPLRVLIRGAGIGGTLDLTGGTLERVRAEGVFIGVQARLPAPREDTDIRINGVFNSLSLVVPEGIPVRVHGSGLPFNAIDRGVNGVAGRPGYDVHVEGLFSAVDVRADRAISPEPPLSPAARPPAEAPAPHPSPARPSPEAGPAASPPVR